VTAIQLETKRVEKPWGRKDLWPGFGDAPEGGDPVGEIWFEDPRGDDPELLVKYLFTSEKLSVQVHPNDAAAHAAGYPRGKDEAWVILAAEPHAVIGLGMRDVMTREELRQSALDGSIEDKLCWKAVKTGDVFYSPAGTVHAIGPGLTLIEIQQNVDLTYRLYDYGRPRELHLDEGIAVSDPVPYVTPFVPLEADKGRLILADGPAFVLEHWARSGSGRLNGDGRKLWLVPLKGSGTIDGRPLQPGTTWLVEDETDLVLAEGTELIVAYPGRGLIRDIWR